MRYVLRRSRLKRKSEMTYVLFKSACNKVDKLIRVHLSIVVSFLRHICTWQGNKITEVRTDVLLEVFEPQTVTNHFVIFIPYPLQLVEPRIHWPHSRLTRVFGNVNYFLVSYEVFETGFFDILFSRVVGSPFPSILSCKDVSRSGPAPRVSNDAEKLQVSTNFIGDILMPIMVWAAHRNIASFSQSSSHGIAAVLGDVDEMVFIIFAP
jgi:hypothetical protein